MDRESWQSNTNSEDTHEIYAHCVSSNTKRKQMKATVLGWIICAASLY